MKKITLLIVLVSFVLTNCKQAANENKNIRAVQPASKTAIEKQQQAEDWTSEIVLNNGIKWQANQETTNGVNAMLSLIGERKVSAPEDFKKLGDTLNEVKNLVIKECTMKGDSHDNLHVWLHPLTEKIELLPKTGSIEEGEKLTSSIEVHLKGYYKYFN